METIKQSVFFEPNLKIKKCHNGVCSGILNTSEIFLWKNQNKKLRYSCKKCNLCGTIYLDCELYNTIKNKEQLEILNADVNEIMQAIAKRKEKIREKRKREFLAVGGSRTLEDKRYIENTSLERSFIQINVNNLKKP